MMVLCATNRVVGSSFGVVRLNAKFASSRRICGGLKKSGRVGQLARFGLVQERGQPKKPLHFCTCSIATKQQDSPFQCVLQNTLNIPTTTQPGRATINRTAAADVRVSDATPCRDRVISSTARERCPCREKGCHCGQFRFAFVIGQAGLPLKGGFWRCGARLVVAFGSIDGCAEARCDLRPSAKTGPP
jgi:hypothetical protein